MSITRNLTLETINFSDTEEVDAFLNEVMAGGLRQVRAESEELVAKGLMGRIVSHLRYVRDSTLTTFWRKVRFRPRKPTP